AVRHDRIGGSTGILVFRQSVHRLPSTADAEITTGLFRHTAPQINAEFDHLVIPLANAFRPRYVDRLDRLSELIEKLTIPVTVVGVGAQASIDGVRRDAERLDRATARFVRAVLKRSPTRGERGEFTRSYLESLGFADSEIDVIGCPSMFMYGPDLKISRKVEALRVDSPIALNISPYVAELGPISLDHAARYPNLVYQAQNRQSLELLLYGVYPMGEGSKTRRSGVPVTLDHPLIRENRVRFFLDPRTWFEHLAGYEFSFGTRIHGNIAALLAGTPAMVLAHDSRTLELAEYHRIPHRKIGDLPERPGETAAKSAAALAAADSPPPVETLMGADPEELCELTRRAEGMDSRSRGLVQLDRGTVQLRLPVGAAARKVRGLAARLRRRSDS